MIIYTSVVVVDRCLVNRAIYRQSQADFALIFRDLARIIVNFCLEGLDLAFQVMPF